MANIHDTAFVHPTASIDDGAVIGPYCVVGEGVTIGSRTHLHNHVVIQSWTRMGTDNEVFPFAVIGADPQDKKFKGERAWCLIGDRNKIREHVTIHRGTKNGGSETRIGDDNLIMVAAHVAHDSIVGNDVVIANQVMLAGHVRIEDGANIGGGAAIHHFTTIGECAFVGGMARIAKDVPPYMIVEGNPAEVRKVNTLGMTRRGFSAAHVEAMKDAFKRLYRDNGAAIATKLDQLRLDYRGVPSIIHLCDQLDASAGGVHGRALEVMRPDDKRAVPDGAAV